MWVVFKVNYTVGNLPPITIPQQHQNIVDIITITNDVNAWATKQIPILKAANPIDTYVTTPITSTQQDGQQYRLIWNTMIRPGVDMGVLFYCVWKQVDQ